MKRRMLAALAAAAVVTGGTLAVTQSPAQAAEDPHGDPANCVLLHLTLNRLTNPNIIDLCI
jgi:hypothetical protein